VVQEEVWCCRKRCGGAGDVVVQEVWLCKEVWWCLGGVVVQEEVCWCRRWCGGAGRRCGGAEVAQHLYHGRP